MTRWVVWVGQKGPTVYAHALAGGPKAYAHAVLIGTGRTLCKLWVNSWTVRDAPVRKSRCRVCRYRARAKTKGG